MDAGLIEAVRSHIGPGTRLPSVASPVQNHIPPKPFSIDQDKAPILVSDDEEDEDEEERDTPIMELKSLLGDVCTYEAFQERVFNIAPNTPIRRFLFRILDAYSRYFPKHKDIPRLLERQAMFDLLCPFIRGALLVYDVKSDISEIPILGSGFYEKDDRKFQEDRRKLARAKKDSWDLAVRKLAEEHSRPHEGLC
ncbi:hypothetical protein BGZ97_008419, partial [Linnemannia gamsii]